MERPIQPGDLIVIDYGYTKQSYPITEIAPEGIYFRSENGESLAIVDAFGKYMVQGLEPFHVITFAAGPEPMIPQPTIPAPIIPQPTVPPPIIPQLAPKQPGQTKPKTGIDLPFVAQIGDRGTIYTPLFDDTGRLTRATAAYPFVVERVLRNGQNVVIRLEAETLMTRPRITLYWRRKRGYFIGIKGVKEEYPLTIIFDRYPQGFGLPAGGD
jgi:hypothetical protein